VRLLDTAGLGPAREGIEAEGMRRSRGAIDASDALIVVLDASIAPNVSILCETAHRPRLVVRAKADLGTHPACRAVPGAIDVSAVTGSGLETLLDRLGGLIRGPLGDDGEDGALAASLRQVECLERLEAALVRGARGVRAAPVEAALVDLYEALGLVGELLGAQAGDDVLDRIFSTFCLGK
jgi:tRNA modification GTPase